VALSTRACFRGISGRWWRWVGRRREEEAGRIPSVMRKQDEKYSTRRRPARLKTLTRLADWVVWVDLCDLWCR